MLHPPASVWITASGCPHVGQVLVVGAGEQGHVAAVEQGQVGDHELDGVGGLQDHERALGELELVGSSGDLVGEVAAGHLPIAVDERHGRRGTGVEQHVRHPSSHQHAATVRGACQVVPASGHLM